VDRVAAAASGSRPFRGCPFVAAAAELPDPQHPGRVAVRRHKRAVLAGLTELAQAAGAADPDRLAEQLLVVIDGLSVQGVTRPGSAAGQAAGQAPGQAARAARRLAELAVDAACGVR
jgi:hypothetical protein